jgi:hypothetical protein
MYEVLQPVPIRINLKAWILYTIVRTPWMGDQPCRKAATYTEEMGTDIHASNGIWTHDPSVCVGEDISCLTPRGHLEGRRNFC